MQATAALREALAEYEFRQPPRGLHPKQLQALTTPATEVLYGGAAGGGKSFLMRAAARAWCRWIPGLQVYLFRREFDDLFKNHLYGPKGFIAMLADDVEAGTVQIVGKQIRFDNGSIIHLCHCQHEKDVYGYQGAEIHVLLIDELTQWTESMYRFLRGRLRKVGLKVPTWLAGMFPRILLSANPGGIGHTWVKASFIDVGPWGDVLQMPKSEGGMRRQFIQALLEDNPSMAEDDPDYGDRLEGLGDPQLVKAMRAGDWNVVSGGFFDDVWDGNVHVIPSFEIPASWRIDRSFDWGSAKPFSVGWWAESDGTKAPGAQRHYPRGTLFRIGEWYGWNGKPNEGCRMLAVEVARGIKEREAVLKQRVLPGPADASIYDVENGNCIADDMAKLGVRWERADKSPGSRKNGAEKLRELLKAAKEQRDESGLYVFNTCIHFIRTVPVLVRDPKKPEDVDSKAEDHAYDETRYRVLALRREWRTSQFSM